MKIFSRVLISTSLYILMNGCMTGEKGDSGSSGNNGKDGVNGKDGIGLSKDSVVINNEALFLYLNSKIPDVYEITISDSGISLLSKYDTSMFSVDSIYDSSEYGGNWRRGVFIKTKYEPTGWDVRSNYSGVYKVSTNDSLNWIAKYEIPDSTRFFVPKVQVVSGITQRNEIAAFYGGKGFPSFLFDTRAMVQLINGTTVIYYWK